MARNKALSLFVVALALTACDAVPRDPEGTLERVRGGTMRVGITAHDPWTSFEGGQPAGIEVDLLQDFADEIDADIEWVPGSEGDLFEALHVGQLDVVIGGFTSTTPYSKDAALTHPYVTTAVVVGVPEGDAVPDDIAGMEVAAETGSEAAGLLSKTDAERLLIEDIAHAPGAAAVDDWLLDDLGLRDTGVRLSEHDHVMAVRLGENGWLVTLERFLLERGSEIRDMVQRQGPS